APPSERRFFSSKCPRAEEPREKKGEEAANEDENHGCSGGAPGGHAGCTPEWRIERRQRIGLFEAQQDPEEDLVWVRQHGTDARRHVATRPAIHRAGPRVAQRELSARPSRVLGPHQIQREGEPELPERDRLRPPRTWSGPERDGDRPGPSAP